jgi:hypothetical protein
MDAQEYQETLEFLAQTPQHVASLIAGFDRNALRFRPEAGTFSALEVVCHLRDVEREGYTIRVSRILEEDNPQLDGIDGGRLAVERDYQSQDPEAALEAFETARLASLQILRDASPAELGRRCSLEDSIGLTLAGLADQMRVHDAGHLAELEALREQLLHAQEAVAIRIQ